MLCCKGKKRLEGCFTRLSCVRNLNTTKKKLVLDSEVIARAHSKRRVDNHNSIIMLVFKWIVKPEKI